MTLCLILGEARELLLTKNQPVLGVETPALRAGVPATCQIFRFRIGPQRYWGRLLDGVVCEVLKGSLEHDAPCSCSPSVGRC